MKGWTKRRVALILALAMIASQMSGCKDNGTAAQNAVSVSNNNAAVTEETQAPTEETVSEDAEGWLEENLDNIRQSLLEGDYAEVVEILLGMQNQLANDPDFNALLYIAYMGNGNEAEAEALLNNPNLDTDAFTDAFLENTEALKGNSDMADIERSLMEHMLGLGKSNPDAYDAVARIGANINNDDPTDPTAYAARYIAALAAGDEAAAKAILAEAEANGISAEALETTVIAYIEEHNLTNVTVTEETKGKTTSTTYSEAGNVVKVEETVTNPDGSKTEIAKDKNGVVYGIAQYGKDSKIVSRTVYHFELVLNPDTGLVEQKLAQVDVQTYTDGAISSLVMNNVDADGNLAPDMELTFNAQGVISSYVVYVDGEKHPMSTEKIKETKATVVDGDLMSISFPITDESGAVIGKIESEYSYYHPAGVIEDRKMYKNGQLVMDADYNYSYTSGDVENISVNANFVDKDGKKIEALLDYANGQYIEKDEDGNQAISKLDVTNKYPMTMEVHDADGNLTERHFAYYTGTEMTGELWVKYDAAGNVIEEALYEVSRDYDPDTSVVTVTSQAINTKYYNYDTNGNLVSTEEYIGDEDARLVEYATINGAQITRETHYKYSEEQNSLVEVGYTHTECWYDVENGDRYEYIAVVDYVAGTQNACLNLEVFNDSGKTDYISRYVYDTNGDPQFSEQDQYYYNANGDVEKVATGILTSSGVEVTRIINYTYNEDGSKKVETKDMTTGKSSVTEYTYTEAGDTLSESVYEVDADNNRVDVSVKDYTYGEDGKLSGYTVTSKDADGNTKTTHYTSEGYAYEVAVYDTQGQLLMVMRLDPETGDVETTEGGSTEGGNTEGGSTEGGNTEGGNTEGGNTEGSNTEGGNTEGGTTEGGNTEGGNTEGGSTEGGNTEGGNSEVGNTDSGNTAGGSNEAPAQSPAVTETPVAPKEPETPAEPEGNEPAGE